MSRSYRFPGSRPSLSALILIAASQLAACTFGPRELESAPQNTGDDIAEASAHEGETKVDKDGFRTPDAQRVMADAPTADSEDTVDGDEGDADSKPAEGKPADEEDAAHEEDAAAEDTAVEQPKAVTPKVPAASKE